MVSISEFGDAAPDFPILFVRAAPDALGDTVAPVAVFGLKPGENLFATADDKWTPATCPRCCALPVHDGLHRGLRPLGHGVRQHQEGMSRTEGLPCSTRRARPPSCSTTCTSSCRISDRPRRTRQFCAALLEMRLPSRCASTRRWPTTKRCHRRLHDRRQASPLPDAQIATIPQRHAEPAHPLGLAEQHAPAADRRILQSNAAAAG